MTPALPLSRDIVLIGGGHAHALLLRRWGMKSLPGARLTIINPAPTAPYTGMLPGHVAGHFTQSELEIDLVRLARFAGARIIFGAVGAIDRTNRLIQVPGRAPIGYDYASVDIGITSEMPDIPGFTENGIGAKPLGPFAARWRAHLASGAGPVVVIGAGIAGVELALSMRHAQGDVHKITLIETADALRGIGTRTAQRLRAELSSAGIDLIEQTTVESIEAESVRLSNGQTVASHLTVGAAGARPFKWLAETGLDLHEGYITVKADLFSTNDNHIFAVGDCALLTASPRPKAGVFAVRAAPILTHNLQAAAAGRPTLPFKPQKHYLKLISLGPKTAIADKWGLALGGAWAWRWKDQIDRKFMGRLNQPPRMDAPKLPSPRAEDAASNLGHAPLCGGCGSKIGPGVLDAVLSDLPQPQRADVQTAAGDDAAILKMGSTTQTLSVDHLRAFWEDPWLFGRIAALHALGDIWAMGAAPQSALAQLTLPRMTNPLQERWLRETMTAASEVFAAEGAAIVGGHTTQGAEFSIGFTVTGLSPKTPITLEGARASDALILTRPIGTGTLFAAEMQGKADGRDIAKALEVMATSQAAVAGLLAEHACAMTDVTGFGLAGHAARMAKASGVSIELTLANLPVFDGTIDLAKSGIRSTIWQDNRDAVAFDGPDTPESTLLFDPQTAGGFLAAVPSADAAEICEKLQAAGHSATIIGRVTPPAALTIKAV